MKDSTCREMIYYIDEVPPSLESILLGFQHVLTLFGATIAVPLILGGAMGFSSDQMTILIGAVMITAGVATLLQVTIGTRLPIVQSMSFSFIGPILSIIKQTGGGLVSMQYVAGAIISGSLVEILVGWSGLIGKIRRWVTPVVIGPVIIMIGLSLFSVGAPKAGTHWPTALVVILSIFLFSQILSPKYKFFRLFPVLLAIIIGYAFCAFGTFLGVFPKGHPSHVDFSIITQSPWIRPFDKLVFPWGFPKFNLAFFLTILAGYLASMIESFGDYFSCSYMSRASNPTPKVINKGIAIEGLGCLLSGIWGGFATTSYSENIGLIGLTRVASRYVVGIGGMILILLGIFNKFGACIATIPEPVVGAMYCTVFGIIAAIGIQQLTRVDMQSGRNLLVVGFTLFMALSLPAYIEGVPGLYPPKPITLEWAPWLANALNAILSTEMAVAAIVGLLLDNLIPGTDKERGLVDWK
ncbi:MAG: purine/pyrimidine permease [Synergistetes bacterium]|nr:purine/pyrimidine permease [Synergistota bacterium]MCX8128106.1 purine/pyrimidine permease [Synergistota bacterium]MDW8192482.1 solute carrier family 23 protein [Synergistota bacterium]